MGGPFQTRFKRVPTQSYDSPLLRVHTLGSDEGSMTLQELTVLCTKLSNKVASLEEDLKQTKKVYGVAYTKLIKKVKKLEKTVKSNQARRRAKIVVSNDEEDSEDSSKQGRMIEEINQDAKVTLVTPTQRWFVQEVNISIPSPVIVKDKGKGKMQEYEDEQTKKTKLQVSSWKVTTTIIDMLKLEDSKRFAEAELENEGSKGKRQMKLPVSVSRTTRRREKKNCHKDL
ncbi:hypothetical protein Tco_0078887 [Tanacetum coccineum]